MPGEECDRGEDPASQRVRKKFAKPLRWSPGQERTEDLADKSLRKPMKKRQEGSAEQNERRNHQHEENMLDHVGGERYIIESGQRRANGDPKKKHSSEKRCEPPAHEETGGESPESEPAAEINDRSKKKSYVEPDG